MCLQSPIEEGLREDYLYLWRELGREPSRDDYRNHGGYDYKELEEKFGSFREFKRSFADETVEARRSFEKDIVKSKTKDSLEKKFSDNCSGLDKKYIKKKRSDYHQLIVAGDFHDIYVDDFALRVFLETCKERQPDYINLAGDVMDFYELSTFDKSPNRIFKLQEQIDFVISKILRPVRAACPNAQIDYIIGNHEYRLIRFLMTQGSALASLKCLNLGELLRLDELKINLIILSPFSKLDDDSRNYKVYDDFYVVTHGTATNTNHSGKELNRWKMSGCSGHVHHRQKSTVPYIMAQSATHLNKELDWISFGCMCKPSAGEGYIKDLVRWQQGFNIVHLFPDTQTHINEYIEIKNGVSVVGSKVYKKNGRPQLHNS